MSQIKNGDAEDAKHCVMLKDQFEHSGPNGRHVCMVFEVLGDNLLHLIKRYNYKGIPIPIVRNLTKQMLIGLDYLHRWVGGLESMSSREATAWHHTWHLWCMLISMHGPFAQMQPLGD